MARRIVCITYKHTHHKFSILLLTIIHFYSIIALNYAARAKGVTRHMRRDQAKQLCPEIHLVKVPNVRQKSDLTKYRYAAKEVLHVLKKFTQLVEQPSVDEAYLDITDRVHERLKQLNNVNY